MKAAIIPLDSRPCNMLFPSQLADMAGIEAVIPPAEYMDYFQKPGNCDAISLWLEDVYDSCDVIIASIDMLAYGGLIASRKADAEKDLCLQRISILKEIKKKKPAISIYAFSILMRTSITTTDEESKRWWQKINEYSQHSYLAEVKGEESSIIKRDILLNEIPEHILSQFLEARKRNFYINKKAVEFVGEGVFDFLLLLQEDSHPYGIHKKEQQQLQEIIWEKNIKHRVFLHNGTDEGAMMLMAKASLIHHFKNMPVSLNIQYLNKDNKDFIALYEDRMFAENLYDSLSALGIEYDENSDGVLYIYNPPDIQKDMCLEEGQCSAPYSTKEIEAYADSIVRDIVSGKRVYLLDIVYANGGEGTLLKKIASQISLTDLHGYAAWNTAGNSLGTILSQAVLSGKENSDKNRMFTLERILDDYFYQSVFRQYIVNVIKENGQDIWNIKDMSLAEEIMSNPSVCRKELEQLFGENIPCFYVAPVWNRLFEAKITVKEDYNVKDI